MSRNVMIDLETVGTATNSAILTLGAVEFSKYGLKEQFYCNINVQSCIDVGLILQADTLQWWMQQSEEARTEAFSLGIPLRQALLEFAQWLPNDALVWGNGSDFDNAILATAYRAIDIPLPWKFWNNRCYRTFKNMYPSIKLQRSGTYHNALDDAITQATHMINILNNITEEGEYSGG